MATQQSHLARNYKRADSDVEKFQRQIRKIKYPVLAIEPAEELQTKISQFKNQKLQQQMKQKLLEEKKLTAYRRVRGDGNCFFRALAFEYLSSAKNLANTQLTFYHLNDLSLTICHQQSIPKEFLPFYNDILLKQSLLSNWSVDVRHLALICRQNNKRILSRLFRKNPYLDFIVILYFRSLCLKGLEKHMNEVKDFMKGTQEQEIRTYGEESEGIVLDICSRYIKVAIDVYEVRKQELKHYSYKNEKILKDSLSIALLYYENHYDIIESIAPHMILEQKRDKNIVQEEYYSKINEKMIEGNCIECGKDDYIYEQNFLCDHCFQISRSEMLNTVKNDKWVRGICRDCRGNSVLVLEMISLCEDCVRRQSKVQQSEVYKNSPKKGNQVCRQCRTELGENGQCPVCSLNQIGYCLQCDRKNYIDRQTKLCKQCKQMQEYVLKKQQKKKQDFKNRCPKCNFSINSAIHEYECLKNTKQICHFCGQSKDSEVHQAKCVKKLTAGKIGGVLKTQNISKVQQANKQYENRRCRNCKLLRLDETLVSGWCKKCRQYFMEENKKKESSYFGSGMIPKDQEKIGMLMQSEGQTCKYCRNVYFLHKMVNGACPNCIERHARGVRF